MAEIFDHHPLPFENHVFHDLSPSSDEKFQIDTLMITPSFISILEVKNIAGTLEFKDDPPQLIRTKENGQIDGFESPVVQLERNCELLRDWMYCRNIRIPIYSAIVLAYPKQIVKVPPAKTKLLFPSLIPPFLKGIPRTGPRLNIEAFHSLSAELLNSHHRFIPKPICKSYSIPYSDFQFGVRCPQCGSLGMVKLARTWHCPKCKAHNNHAHQQSLLEWFLLFNRQITNRECREFLQLKNIHAATRILKSMQLQTSGTFKDRSYLMDFTQLPI